MPLGDSFGEPLGDCLRVPLGEHNEVPLGERLGVTLGECLAVPLGDCLAVPFGNCLETSRNGSGKVLLGIFLVNFFGDSLVEFADESFMQEKPCEKYSDKSFGKCEEPFNISVDNWWE